MIRTKKDYLYYLEADKIALNMYRPRSMVERFDSAIVGNVWGFQRLLRKVEYYKNCKKYSHVNPYYYWLYWKLRRAQIKYGFMIGPNIFGPGLSIAHPGPIVVNSSTRVGSNCRIHSGVVIGTEAGYSDKSPHIGSNVFIGPGAKIFGEIVIADGIAIGANSVVARSFLEPNITIAGVPARKISDKGSKGLLIDATEKIKNGTARVFWKSPES